MKRITLLLLVNLIYLQLQAQSFSNYEPIRHFVFPKTKVEVKRGVQPSQINRLENQKIIYHHAFTSCYDTEYNLPVWVSHHLNNDLLINKYNRRPGGYPKNPQYPALVKDAFAQSGYDHGHLAPAADFTWSREAYNQSFFMTNMSPQHACFNQKGWCHLEGTMRKWVEENPNDDFYIVSGAVTSTFIDTLCIQDDVKVFVPKYFYKVVMITGPSKQPRSIGYIVPNKDVDNYSIKSFEVTVDSVERLTGLDFFAFIPKKQQELAESVVAEVTYYNRHITCANSNCETLYRRRVTPQNRPGLRCN